MTSDYSIETRNLAKTYHNGEAVLRGLDLKVPRGSVYGFLGRNGAGKTTAIRIVMGILRPDAGMVRVLGDPCLPMKLETRQRVGYLSQDMKFFDWMTLDRLLAFTSSFYPSWDAAYADELAVRLDVPREIPVGALSRGERQKAGLLLALAQRPDLLVLDEPSASLDTVVRREFLESIIDILTREGITVLISSQILTDVERIADWVGILSEGKMLISAPLDDLKESIKRLRISFPDGSPESIDLPGAIRTIRRDREILVTVKDFSPAGVDGLRSRFAGGVDVLDVDLEDIFIELVR
jgi:ABC-2 type transport system ATP-binding protein